MKTLIIGIFIVYWILGFAWWRKYVYKKVTNSDSPEIWEAIGLWAAFLGGPFCLIHEWIGPKNTTKK